MRNQNKKLANIIERANPTNNPVLTDKQIEILKNTGQVILALAAVAGAITVAGAMPGLTKALARSPWANSKFAGCGPNERKKRMNEEIKRGFYYLKQTGRVHLIPKGDDYIIDVKEPGRKVIRQINFENIVISADKAWDGCWWVVFADVPVKERYWADKFREKLKAMSFYPLQRTVWFYPYDPRDEIDFVSEFYHIYKFVTVMRVDQLNQGDAKILTDYFKEKGLI